MHYRYFPTTLPIVSGLPIISATAFIHNIIQQFKPDLEKGLGFFLNHLVHQGKFLIQEFFDMNLVSMLKMSEQ